MARIAVAWVALAATLLATGQASAQAGRVFPRETLEPQVPERPAARGEATRPLALDDGRPAVAAGGPSFQLDGLEIVGSSVYDAARLAALVADRIGRPVDFAGLREITDRIEALYEADGYIAVRAVVPAQRIAGGVVRVEIVEGAIAEIQLRGELGRAEPEIRRILGPLVGARPLRAAEAERRLLLARDLPGVSLLAALRARPSEVPGELVLLVEGVLTRFDGFVSLSNLASEFAGPVIVTLGAGVNSLVLPGDRLEAVGLASLQVGEEALGQLSYEMPTGIDGLRLRVTGSNTISETGGPLSVLDIDYRSQIVGISAEYKVIRSRARTVTVGGGFEFVHQESNNLLPGLGIDEDLRVVSVGARLIESNLFGGLLDASTELRFGLDVLGANSRGDPNLTGGADTDPQFVSAGFEIGYARALGAGFSVAGRVLAQVSTGDLPTFEAFSLGNYTIGRGFDPGSVTGDDGVAASLTLNYLLDIPELPVVTDPTLFAFVEGGRAWGEIGGASLTSVGGGARWRMWDQLDAEVVLAVPVQSPDFVDADDLRGLFRVTTFF